MTVVAGRGPADLDQLDCLQQAAVSVRVGRGCVNCVAGAEKKGEEVARRCGGGRGGGHQGAAMSGVTVICWGCGVWHRSLTK